MSFNRLGEYFPFEYYPISGNISIYDLNNNFIFYAENCSIPFHKDEYTDSIYIPKNNLKTDYNLKCGHVYKYVFESEKLAIKYNCDTLLLKGLLIWDDNKTKYNNEYVIETKPIIDYANIISNDSQKSPTFCVMEEIRITGGDN